MWGTRPLRNMAQKGCVDAGALLVELEMQVLTQS
ncbi:hypothetical protein MP11Mi_15050 [Gordonia sp. MP11Mi]|uniref:Uncharacterized protein n=1 Tax=Gordonia sp. MP11Mi TaxID=3022769 RepID=A0AA97CU42_9ACTN